MGSLTIDNIVAGRGEGETRRGGEASALRVSASPCLRVPACETVAPSPARLFVSSSSLAAMLDQAVVSAASFITSVFVGRFCGEESLGLYSLGFTLLILVRGVQESLVLTPYTILSPRLSNRRRASYAGSVLVHSGLAALISMLIVGLGAVALSVATGLPRLAPVLGMLAVMLPLLLLRELARRFLFADLNLGRALLLDLTVAACQLALIAWLSAVGWLSAITAHTASGLACAVAAVAWLLRSRQGLRIRRRRIAGDWIRNWSLSRWIFAEHLCGIANASSPQWLLALLLGAAATGEFAAATTVVLLLNPFIIGLGNLLGPTTARAYATGGVSEMRRIVQKFTLGLAGLLLLFCLLIAGFGGWALAALYGPQYAGQGAVVTLLALGLAINALGMGADNALRAVGRPRDTFLASLLALTITLAVGAWLAPAWHIVGIACAALTGNLAGTFARWLAFARCSNAARAAGATA